MNQNLIFQKKKFFFFQRPKISKINQKKFFFQNSKIQEKVCDDDKINSSLCSKYTSQIYQFNTIRNFFFQENLFSHMNKEIISILIWNIKQHILF